MKELVPLEDVRSQRHREDQWQEITEALKSLPNDMALPIEVDDAKEAAALQYFILQRNAKSQVKYRAQRRKNTVFISKVS